MIDETDRRILVRLQRDATTPYAELAAAVGLSAASVHARVRRLRESGVIRRTTVEVDPAAVGRGVLAFVTVTGDVWMGDPDTVEAFAGIAGIEEAHIVAGTASVLVKVRAATTEGLQSVLREIFHVPGVTGTQTTVVLETGFSRPVTPEVPSP
ncbi:DNA-binding Lrp family transcriptional regulator [Stackebrandtia albiflava]|uniref:DNA-binding Lrp family transcriptional regulator n=1 Tax=Stackebrandtia albiflava TaxID=406432 RepID=A0A562V140_9ACTN|nr:Lrp/AsnC family transcriptional regulator [Stackebrandtia albiflava]TWJ11584.1 DNA-binding Lrp family transcriptional regulator [Stackebrandtia albiflava]